MANTINWGKIYESTAWGNTDNSISWGKSYADLAGGGGFTGLLDTYSGAAAAYSLRQLSSTYSGDAIVVTTNGSDSASIGFVNNELDTASLEAFAGSGDAYVSVWYDQSGNGNNATQTSFSAMPKIVSAGSTILENGKAAIQWDGSNDNMVATGFGTGQQRSVFTTMVGNGNGSGYENYFIFAQSGSITGNFMQIYSTNYTSSLNANFPTASLDITSSTAPNTQQIISFLKTTSNSYVYQNTSLSGSGSGTQALEDYLNLGNFSNNYAFVKYQEFIVYNSDESTNRTGIETNINSY